MFYYHSALFGFIGFSSLLMLAISAHIISVSYFGASALGFVLFVALFTLLGLGAHWLFSYFVAIIWATITGFFYLVAAGVATSRSWYAWGDISYKNGVYTYSDHMGEYNAMLAFAWLGWFAWLLVPVAFYIHIYRRKDAGWNDGIYGSLRYPMPRFLVLKGRTSIQQQATGMSISDPVSAPQYPYETQMSVTHASPIEMQQQQQFHPAARMADAATPAAQNVSSHV